MDRGDDADRGRPGQRHDGERGQRLRPDPGLQRPSVELVERVRADTHAEEERDQREAEDARPPARRERGPDDDVGEVPGGVRRV